MGKNLFDFLEQKVIDVYKEYSRLDYYVHGIAIENIISGPNFEEYIDDYLFDKISFRGSHININDLLRDFNWQGCNNIEDLFLYCEVLYNIINDLELTKSDNDDVIRISNNIVNNINEILNKTNHKLVKCKKGFIIVVNDSAVNLAASLVDENSALSIFKYNYFNIKGNIELKRNILCDLALYLEPKLHDKKSKYEFLLDDISFMLNCFNIRHNNLEGKNKKEYIENLNNDEIEEWYDKLYKMMIAAIIIIDNYSTHDELDKIKKQTKGN